MAGSTSQEAAVINRAYQSNPPAQNNVDLGAVALEWRTRALTIVLLVIAITGLPAYLLPIGNALQTGQMTPLLWIYLGVYLVIIGLTGRPRPAQVRHALGLYGFLYVVIHVWNYAVGENSLDWELIARVLEERRANAGEGCIAWCTSRCR